MIEPLAVCLAPAKLNLGLEVIGRRNDGYHEIVSILQTVSLFDRFEWSPAADGFRYRSPLLAGASPDLVSRALQTAATREDWTGNLTLRKVIPYPAGLGGGASDAAVALRFAHPGRPIQELEQLASKLGSDVPFFVRGGTALVTGTGTSIEPLPTPVAWFVVVTPQIALPSKTASMYAALTTDDFSNGNTVRAIARAIEYAGALETAPPNAFARHALSMPPVKFARDALTNAGATWVGLSGAGPSVYAVMPSYREAFAVARRVPSTAGAIFVVRSVPADDRQIGAETIAELMRATSRPR